MQNPTPATGRRDYAARKAARIARLNPDENRDAWDTLSAELAQFRGAS